MTLEGQMTSALVAPGMPEPGGHRSRGGGGYPSEAGLDAAALIVGIVALLCAGAAVVGAAAALAGIVLGVLAVRAARHRVRSLAGLVLSSVAITLNVIVTVVTVVAIHSGGADASADAKWDVHLDELARTAGPTEVVTAALTTPCYSFDAPATYLNNQSERDTAGCWTTRQLWGEYNADGTVTNTGAGASYATVGVEPITAERSAEVNPTGTVNGMVDYLHSAYIPQMGRAIGDGEGDGEIFGVDGTLGILTRVVTTDPRTKTRALLVLRAPTAYRVERTEVRFFLVSFVTVEENGDAIIEAAISSWRWN